MAQAAGLLALPQECLASIVGHVAVAAEEDDAYARYAEDPKPVNALESLNGTCQLLRQLARELLYDHVFLDLNTLSQREARQLQSLLHDDPWRASQCNKITIHNMSCDTPLVQAGGSVDSLLEPFATVDVLIYSSFFTDHSLFGQIVGSFNSLTTLILDVAWPETETGEEDTAAAALMIRVGLGLDAVVGNAARLGHLAIRLEEVEGSAAATVHLPARHLTAFSSLFWLEVTGGIQLVDVEPASTFQNLTALSLIDTTLPVLHTVLTCASLSIREVEAGLSPKLGYPEGENLARIELPYMEHFSISIPLYKLVPMRRPTFADLETVLHCFCNHLSKTLTIVCIGAGNEESQVDASDLEAIGQRLATHFHGNPACKPRERLRLNWKRDPADVDTDYTRYSVVEERALEHLTRTCADLDLRHLDFAPGVFWPTSD